VNFKNARCNNKKNRMVVLLSGNTISFLKVIKQFSHDEDDDDDDDDDDDTCSLSLSHTHIHAHAHRPT